MTDTPESDKAKIAFTLMFANDDAYLIPYTVGMKLERERDEARAMACDMRNQFEKESTSRLLFPWENDKDLARRALDSE